MRMLHILKELRCYHSSTMWLCRMTIMLRIPGFCSYTCRERVNSMPEPIRRDSGEGTGESTSSPMWNHNIPAATPDGEPQKCKHPDDGRGAPAPTSVGNLRCYRAGPVAICREIGPDVHQYPVIAWAQLVRG